MTQFIKAAFGDGDNRTYTYVNDGDPVKVDDRVRVETKHGGEAVVIVREINLDAPSFECRAVLGLAPPKEAAA